MCWRASRRPSPSEKVSEWSRLATVITSCRAPGPSRPLPLLGWKSALQSQSPLVAESSASLRDPLDFGPGPPDHGTSAANELRSSTAARRRRCPSQLRDEPDGAASAVTQASPHRLRRSDVPYSPLRTTLRLPSPRRRSGGSCEETGQLRSTIRTRHPSTSSGHRRTSGAIIHTTPACWWEWRSRLGHDDRPAQGRAERNEGASGHTAVFDKLPRQLHPLVDDVRVPATRPQRRGFIAELDWGTGAGVAAVEEPEAPFAA